MHSVDGDHLLMLGKASSATDFVGVSCGADNVLPGRSKGNRLKSILLAQYREERSAQFKLQDVALRTDMICSFAELSPDLQVVWSSPRLYLQCLA